MSGIFALISRLYRAHISLTWRMSAGGRGEPFCWARTAENSVTVPDFGSAGIAVGLTGGVSDAVVISGYGIGADSGQEAKTSGFRDGRAFDRAW